MIDHWRSRYPDWDQPDEENAAAAAKFRYETFAEEEIRFPYRLFLPGGENTGKKRYPLVLFLHGADTTGEDNEAQLLSHDIGTVFARESWQAHDPCFVAAPQYKSGLHWSGPRMQAALLRLIQRLQDTYGTIDPDRILLYGYSAGGIGALSLMKAAPGVFHKALVICAATGAEDADALTKTPFWLFHAADDPIVPAGDHDGVLSYYMGSASLYAHLKDRMGEDLRYMEYAPGELKKRFGVHPHCAWYAAGQDEAAKKWLFT